MADALWREQVLYRRRLNYFNEKRQQSSRELSLLEMLELSELISLELIDETRISLCRRVVLENNFDDVFHYLKWLDSLVTTIHYKQYFMAEQYYVCANPSAKDLDTFLTDAQGMFYYPHIILDVIRKKIMAIQQKLTRVSDDELLSYYQTKLQGFAPTLAQPLVALCHMAELSL